MNKEEWQKQTKAPAERNSKGQFIKGCSNPNKHGETRNCLQCSEEFWAVGSKIAEGKGMYCSCNCAGLASKGRRNSPETEFKKGELADEKHPNWKGDEVGYFALHAWLQRKVGKAECCENRKDGCLPFKCSGKSETYNWANRSKLYKRDLTDWLSLCMSCHMRCDKGGIKL